MRLFVALDIDDAIRDRVAAVVETVRQFAPDASWVRMESLHVTLKFIGEKSADSVKAIERALASIVSNALKIELGSFGFFPSETQPRVFWAGIEANPGLRALAQNVDQTLAALGIAREEHDYHPHLTLARLKGSSGAPQKRPGDRVDPALTLLRERLATLPPPEFGTMTARQFFLYQSRTVPGGSQYTKLAAYSLR